ncbi:intersectin-1-like [Gossypium australe]|uniref:Intersectin-1-like n=1 Tax=Gossypium australe TaxID=47621 RepID=A0A5B6VNT7_9ROSI|nr:intersectin-1-like [Gossypium australe]
MMDRMMESQQNMMSQLTQLLAGGMDKGKGPMDNITESNQYPPSFTPTHVHALPEINPQRPSVSIRPQQTQTRASTPINFQVGSGSNPGHNPNNPIVPDLDEVVGEERVVTESQRQLEERCKWLEEKFKAMETINFRCGVEAKDLSLVPNLVLPQMFKIPEFERYNGTSCPEAHIMMFCRRMTGYVNNHQLLIHFFQESLTGSAARWYN